MLLKNPKERPSSSELLEHKYLLNFMEATDEPVPWALSRRMKNYKYSNALKKEVLKACAARMEDQYLTGESRSSDMNRSRRRGAVGVSWAIGTLMRKCNKGNSLKKEVIKACGARMEDQYLTGRSRSRSNSRSRSSARSRGMVGVRCTNRGPVPNRRGTDLRSTCCETSSNVPVF
jgi:hypothetical protein